MTVFVFSVSAVLIISALCSLSEAALYSVRTPFVRRLAEAGSSAGSVLSKFKRSMEYPISAILILNTAANTAGAAIAGAQARLLFGEQALLWFSAAFTLAVLFFSEIVPKVVGVVYNRNVAKAMALPLNALVVLLMPMLFVVRRTTRWLRPKGRILAAPEDEVRHMVMMSAEEGSILPFEAELVKNVLELNDLTAREIMTPRPVVHKFPSDLTVRDAAAKVDEWTYSRIPVYSAADPEVWTGIVLSRDILSKLAEDEFETTLDGLKKPLHFVSEKTPGHILLRSFLKKRSHLFGVVDEYGGVMGIVSLEDVLESVIGDEIVDEVDSAVDLQQVAKLRRQQQLKKEGTEETDPKFS
jgi:CBS domain containing-hemolysin-like protein